MHCGVSCCCSPSASGRPVRLRRVWGWRMVLRYAEIIRADGFSGLRRPTEDTLQLGGDFLVDANGTLIYGFWGEGPDDRPEVDELIAALR